MCGSSTRHLYFPTIFLFTTATQQSPHIISHPLHHESFLLSTCKLFWGVQTHVCLAMDILWRLRGYACTCQWVTQYDKEYIQAGLRVFYVRRKERHLRLRSMGTYRQRYLGMMFTETLCSRISL